MMFLLLQLSVLGPVLLSFYMLPLGNIIQQERIDVYCYADDTQLYFNMKPGKTEQMVYLQACLKGKVWDFPLLHSDKTVLANTFGHRHLKYRSLRSCQRIS